MNLFNLIEIHTFVLICELLILFVVIRMVTEKQKPSSMMAWLVAIILVPYIAVPFYFIFGIRKRKRRKHKSEFNLRKIDYIDRSKPYATRTVLINQDIPAPTSNNQLQLYTDGVSSYQTLIECIKQARSSIYFSTYVFKKDAVL